MDISIVIVNYNSWNVLEECIQSILSLKTSVAIETIVVDNCSPNDLLTTYQEKYPSVLWIKNSGNNGFANGCNFGANHAKGSYLFFLNPDTQLQEGVLEHFLDIYTKEDIGLLSCIQSNKKGGIHKYHLLFPTAMRTFGVLRSIERKINNHKHKIQYKETETRCYPDWISGSAVFVSSTNFKSIGQWNEDYWMYFEDVDLSKKAQLQGLDVVVTKEVSIFHLHGGSSRINPKTKAITKSEVIKSRHTYISNYFTKRENSYLHFVLIIGYAISIGLLAILSIPFFFIKKLQVNRFKSIELYSYYKHVYTNKTWLSERSMNLKS